MPTNSMEMYEKARQFWEDGELDEAEIVYRQLIAFDPKFTYAFYDLGVLLKESKPEAKDEIRTYLERFIKLAKSDTSLREQVISAQETIESLSSPQQSKIDLTGRWKHPLLGGVDRDVLLIQVKQEHEKIMGILSKRFFLKREGRYIHEGRIMFEGKIDGMAGKVSFSHEYNENVYLQSLEIGNEDYFTIGKHYSFFRLDHSDTIIKADPKAAEQAESKARGSARQVAKEIEKLLISIEDCRDSIRSTEDALGNFLRPPGFFEKNKLKKEFAEANKKLGLLKAETEQKIVVLKHILKDHPELKDSVLHARITEKLFYANISW